MAMKPDTLMVGKPLNWGCKFAVLDTSALNNQIFCWV